MSNSLTIVKDISSNTNELLQVNNHSLKVYNNLSDLEKLDVNIVGGGATGDATEATLDAFRTENATNLGTIDTSIEDLTAKITFGDANTLANVQCVGLYAERSGGAWVQLQTDIGNYLKTTDANITKGNDATLVEAQQVIVYGRDAGGTLRPQQMTSSGLQMIEVEGHRVNGSQIGWTIANGATATSTEIQMGGNTRVAFYGDTNNTFNANFFLQYSQDGVSWFRGSDDNSKVIIVSATGNFYDEEIITPPRVRLTRTNNSGATETVNLYWTRV